MKSNAPLVAMLVLFAPLVGLYACGPKLDPVVDSTGGDASTGTGGGAETEPGTTTGTGGGTTTPGTSTGGTGATANVCGTNGTTIGYAAQAKAVIATSCASSSCHGGRTPIMTDYASTKAGINADALNRISTGNMPLGSSLTANQKCIITTWASGNYAP